MAKILVTTDEKPGYSELSWKMLAIIGGLILFFPGISGYLSPPYVSGWALVCFWVFAGLALILNFITHYLAEYVRKQPVKMAGLGNWFTILAIIFFSIYLTANIYDDKNSDVRIIQTTVSKTDPGPGEWVTLSADAIDQDNDVLRWEWKVSDRLNSEKSIGTKKTLTWRIPADTRDSVIQIVCNVKDDGKTVSDTIHLHINLKSMSAEIKAYFQHRINLKIADLMRERNGTDARILASDLEKLVEMATGNVSDLLAISHSPESISHSLDNYLSAVSNVNKLAKKDWRPCCKDFIGLWPFCRLKCDEAQSQSE